MRINVYDTTAQGSTIRFNPSIIVGNMGESLDFGVGNHDDSEDESVATPLSEMNVPSGTRSTCDAGADA
jgi:hypothetical protein